MNVLVSGFLAAGLALAAAAASFAADPDGALKARAELVNSKGQQAGAVFFEQQGDTVRITVKLENLPPGEHGLHIHAAARCERPSFKTAGGHFNPDNREHGFMNPRGPHAGDLPNIIVGSNGKATAVFTTRLVTLKAGASRSLIGKDGTSVVVHQAPDDYSSDPAGHAGDRLACGAVRAEQ